MARNGSAYLVKNRAVPRDLAQPVSRIQDYVADRPPARMASVTKNLGSARGHSSERICVSTPIQVAAVLPVN